MTVGFATENGVARLVLDNPDRRNALSLLTLDSIIKSVARAESEGANCLVLSASGPVFSAGADFADLTGTEKDEFFDSTVCRARNCLRDSDLAVLAVVDGPCLGAGVDLISGADIIIATPRARFEVPAARLGILYNPESLEYLHSRISGGLIRSLLLGLEISASDALTGGLVARLVAPADLDATVDQIVTGLVTAHQDALIATKQLLNELDQGTFKPDNWRDRRLELLNSPERFEIINHRKKTARS